MAEITREVPVFIASSVTEFEREREKLAVALDLWNSVYKRLHVRVEWDRPETMSRALYRGGSQRPFDDRIRACEVFVLLVGKDLGTHTEAEFDLAVREFAARERPLILPYFLNVYPSMDVLRFKQKVRHDLDIDE